MHVYVPLLLVLLLSSSSYSHSTQSKRAFYDEPDFDMGLGFGKPNTASARGPSPSAHPLDAMRFRARRNPSPSPSLPHRPDQHRPSIAERLSVPDQQEPMFQNSPQPPLEHMPAFHYGEDASSHAASPAMMRFRERHEPTIQHANPDDPFGGAPSRHVPRPAQQVHVANMAQPHRFEAPSFSEVYSQIKTIMRDPKPNKHAQQNNVAAAAHHAVHHVVHSPNVQPPMSPPPVPGPHAGPPVPISPPILNPVDRPNGIKAQQPNPTPSPAFAETRATTTTTAPTTSTTTHHPRFQLVTAEQERAEAARLRAERLKDEANHRRATSKTPPVPELPRFAQVYSATKNTPAPHTEKVQMPTGPSYLETLSSTTTDSSSQAKQHVVSIPPLHMQQSSTPYKSAEQFD